MKSMCESPNPNKRAEAEALRKAVEAHIEAGGSYEVVPTGVVSNGWREAIRAEYRERALKANKARWG